MYKVYLFQYKYKFNTVFNVNPGNTSSPIIFSIYSSVFLNLPSSVGVRVMSRKILYTCILAA
jgi:hypothetical protein